MARVALEAALLLVLPVLAYVALLVARSRSPFLAAYWTAVRLATLAVSGLGVLLLALLLLGVFTPRHQGAYSPAHVEDGHLVPGRIE